MNTKVLASLGVVVAFLMAWLVFSLFTASSVIIEEAAPSAATSFRSPSIPSDAIGAGQSKGVETSVMVANQDVKTSVRVAE